MNVRAKFEVTRVSQFGYAGQLQQSYAADATGKWCPTGIPIREIHLNAVCDDGLARENKSFATATPSGEITFRLDNMNLKDEFQPGQIYYVDFTPVS